MVQKNILAGKKALLHVWPDHHTIVLEPQKKGIFRFLVDYDWIYFLKV